jgi:hypothetical protein
MRIIALGLLVSGWLVSGCSEYSGEPGEPEVFLPQSLIQGEPTEARVRWTYGCEGTGDWKCPPASTITVLRVACQGCSVIDDPTGTHDNRIGAVATKDGPITLDVTVRFDDTGEIRQVSASTTGEHEVALEAQCRLIDTSTLAMSNLHHVHSELFRACGKARLASETVVVFPRIRTSSGSVRIPFCLDAYPCTGQYGEQHRPLSSFSITPAPTGWGSTDTFELLEFAILPPLGLDRSVSLSVPLATGTIVKTSVTIPPLQ